MWPVPSHDDHLVHNDHLNYDDHLDHDDHLDTLMTSVFLTKLEVVHKQVGGYLTRCAPIAASIALN